MEKVRLVAERLTVAPVPVPLRATLCGLPVALSVKVTAADSAPINEGVKVTLTVQVPLAATELPQVLVWLKSPELVPEMATPVTLSAALPLLVRVTDWAELEVPTA